jgi:hypothetical protein
VRNSSAEAAETPETMISRLTPNHSENPRGDADKGRLPTTFKKRPKHSGRWATSLAPEN